MTFVYQSAQDARARVPATLSPQSARSYRSHWASAPGPSSRRASSPVPLTNWSQPPPPPAAQQTGQLSLFVIFEKKAGMIRIADSAVGELELWDAPAHARRASGPTPAGAGGSFRRTLPALEPARDRDRDRGAWAAPAEITLPLDGAGAGVAVYLLTRGTHTHIVPAPLAMPLGHAAPLRVLRWGMRPTRVVPRVCADGAPFLQVTALGADGVEAQELPLGFLAGRGGERAVVAQADVGPGGAGFLCMGGQWAGRGGPGEGAGRRARESGFYGWTQKGYGDWRVFWLGGACP